MRDHGGNLDGAIARFGGGAEDWIDLSTGITRIPYPLPALAPELWTALPRQSRVDALIAGARGAYGTAAPILSLAGAQGAIQLIPHLAPPGRARVLAPTYNEHAGALRAAGWQVEEVATIDALAGADLAVVVNPNNPDGQSWPPEALRALIGRVWRLVVDESFGDIDPDLSLAAECGAPGLIVLRSFGKFYGLAGLRLGFALGPEADLARMAAMAGPWPVPGPALEIGRVALADRAWAAATRARLRRVPQGWMRWPDPQAGTLLAAPRSSVYMTRPMPGPRRPRWLRGGSGRGSSPIARAGSVSARRGGPANGIVSQP